jgi:hypothetical protein
MTEFTIDRSDPKFQAALEQQKKAPIAVALAKVIAEIQTRYNVALSDCHWIVSPAFRRDFELIGVCVGQKWVKTLTEAELLNPIQLHPFRIHGILTIVQGIEDIELSSAKLYCANKLLAVMAGRGGKDFQAMYPDPQQYRF